MSQTLKEKSRRRERDRENEIWMQKISFKDFADSFETNLKASSSFKSGLFADKSTYLTSLLEYIFEKYKIWFKADPIN